MNNKPVRRMEVVCVMGNVGITLFSGGLAELGRRARGRAEEFHCSSVQVPCVFCSLSQRDLGLCFFRQLSPPPQEIPIPTPRAFREPASLNPWELNPGR